MVTKLFNERDGSDILTWDRKRCPNSHVWDFLNNFHLHQFSLEQNIHITSLTGTYSRVSNKQNWNKIKWNIPSMQQSSEFPHGQLSLPQINDPRHCSSVSQSPSPSIQGVFFVQQSSFCPWQRKPKRNECQEQCLNYKYKLCMYKTNNVCFP